jgi:O-antigen ligase
MEDALKAPSAGNRAPRPRRVRLPAELGIAALALGVGIVLGVVVAAATPLYTVAGLVGLAATACVFADVRFALFGFIAVATLLPFGTIPVPLGPVTPTLLDACLLSLLLVWILRLLADRREHLWSTGVDVPVLLFVGASLTSFVLGTAYQTTTSDARHFAEILNGLIFFFSVANNVRDLTTVRRLLMGLVGGGAAAGIVGIVLYYLPPATSTGLLAALSRIGYPSSDILQYNPGTTVQRAIGTSIDPNILGATLMMCGAIAVGLLVSSRPRKLKALFLISLVPMMAALLLTYSRGSLIGFLAGCAVIATLRYRRLWLIAGLAAIAIALTPQLADSNFLTHLQSGLEVKDQAAAMRLGEYKDAFRLIEQYPWFGVGFGHAPDVDLYVGVSSIYLLLAEQVGLVGLAIWTWSMASILIRGLRGCLRSRDEASGLALACLAALVSALVAGLFDHHFVDFPHVVALVWMIAGLLMVALRPSVRAPRAAAGDDVVAPGSASASRLSSPARTGRGMGG